MLEVRKNADADPFEQYTWHPYYIDALAMRVYDADTDGVLNENNDGDHYYTQDANFNVTAVLNSSGNVLERYAYSSYGEIQFLDSSFGSISSTTIENSVTYTGRSFDVETGLYYYRFRDYHPTVATFLGRDPIRYAAGNANLYGYVANNPPNYLDPTGLETGPKGHHIVVQEIWKDLDPNSDAFKVFDSPDARIQNSDYRCHNGKSLESPSGGISHYEYNQAVKAEMEAYLRELGHESVGDLSEAEASGFVKKIKNAPKSSVIGKYNAAVRAELRQAIAEAKRARANSKGKLRGRTSGLGCFFDLYSLFRQVGQMTGHLNSDTYDWGEIHDPELSTREEYEKKYGRFIHGNLFKEGRFIPGTHRDRIYHIDDETGLNIGYWDKDGYHKLPPGLPTPI